VGYDEGGQLTEKVRRKPFSVVLFDEIEKAHPDVFNTLLQILEDGRLTDGQGRIVDFKNTVIILTTNLGTRDITGSVPIGFQPSHGASTTYDRMKRTVGDALKQHFRPEFLNRIDDTIVFPRLTEDDIRSIVDVLVARIDRQLRQKDMGVEMTDAARRYLARKGFDPSLGARPLRRTIQREVEDSLAERILFNELRPGRQVVIDCVGDPADVDNAHLVFGDRREEEAATPA
jgi:ATP-dependent Clp protease ATP-binding subunit ClpC